MSTVPPDSAPLNRNLQISPLSNKVLLAAISLGCTAALDDRAIPYAIALLAVGLFVVLHALPQVAIASLPLCTR